MNGIRSVSLLALLALGGCVSVAYEPALPFPERPPVQFSRTPSGICTSEDEAQAMIRWIQKLNEFEAVRDRLLRRDPDAR